MKKRRPVDAWYFDLLIEACGNKCGACGKHQRDLEHPLERGHIKLHADGGEVDPENIMPVCRGCNKKYTKSDTPFDHLPPNYLKKLAVMILRRFNPQIPCRMVDNPRRMVLTNEPDENTVLIDWFTGDFALRTEVSTRPHHTSPHDRRRVVDEMVIEARNQFAEHPPAYPTIVRQSKLQGLVDDHGEQHFKNVARFYFMKQPWIAPDGRWRDDAWGQLADGFSMVEREYRAAEKRRIAGLAEQAKRARESAEKDGVRRLETRWAEYLQIATLKMWDGITDDDREFIEQAAADKGAALREVDDEDIERGREVLFRHNEREKVVLYGEKIRLLDRLNKLSKLDVHDEYVQEIKWNAEGINGAKDLEYLEAIENRGIEPIAQQLEPWPDGFDPDADNPF